MRKLLLLIILILLVAACLRFYKLGAVPEGISWDEAALGYNGWSLWTFRRDEWLIKLPLSIKSFGDYKAPVAVYLTGLFTTLLGLKPLSVRLPFALAGFGSVVFTALGFYHLYRTKKIGATAFVYGTFIAAIIPWHIHFSRTGFENGIALSVILLALILPLYVKLKYSLPLAMVLAISTLYIFHGAKVFIPLILIVLIIMGRKFIFSNKKMFLFLMILAGVLVIPLANDILNGEGATRANVLISFDPTHPQLFTKQVVANLASYADSNYLLGGSVDTLRHGDGRYGILLPSMLALVPVGILYALRRRHPFDLMTLTWLLLGFLPAIIASPNPHASRSFFALPALVVLSVLGWQHVYTFVSKRLSRVTIMSLCMVLVLIDSVYSGAYLQHYFTKYPTEAADSFQAGYEQLVESLVRLESRNMFDQYVISTAYGHPYIFLLFFKQIPVLSYHQGALYKYLFLDSVKESDLYRNKSVVVATIHDQLPIEADEIVYSPSGVPRFYIYYSQGDN